MQNTPFTHNDLASLLTSASALLYLFHNGREHCAELQMTAAVFDIIDTGMRHRGEAFNTPTARYFNMLCTNENILGYLEQRDRARRDVQTICDGGALNPKELTFVREYFVDLSSAVQHLDASLRARKPDVTLKYSPNP